MFNTIKKEITLESSLENDIKKIEDSNKEIYFKSKIYEKLGFNKVGTVQNKDELEYSLFKKRQDLSLQKKIKFFHKKYYLEYPSYKFISKSGLDSVLSKYDLYLGKPEDYLKDIPIEHLEKISNFPLETKYTIKQMIPELGEGIRPITIETFDEEKDRDESLTNIKNRSNYRCFKGSITTLHIVAPLDHFDLLNKDVVNRKIVQKIEDPIALHKVEGGYIIITAWDKEADIIEIQNPLNN